MAGKMKVTVLTGPQGSGKSTVMREEAIAQPGLYLFAAPTHELIDEQAEAFRKEAPRLKVWPVHSKVGGKGKVEERLAFARSEIIREGHAHAVILTTHDALMGSDQSAFRGWHARIDEAPAAIQAGVFDISEARPSLKTRFHLLSKADSEWSGLSLIGSKPNWKKLQASLGAKELVEFYKQAQQPARVFVKAADWDERDDIAWFSMWTPLELAGFASVEIAGTSYPKSVGYHAALALFEERLEFDEREISAVRKGQPNVLIHYFASAHRGSTTYWKTSDGRLQIKKVCDYLAGILPTSAFWSGNEVVQHLMEHRIEGTLIPASAAGLNKHRERKHCAFIFSAKATDDDKPMMKVFGLTKADIEAAREDDIIAQFAMRGFIRNLEYDGPYDIYVYEKVQAERLLDHLANLGFTKVEFVAEDGAGIMKTRRKSDGPNEAEKAEKKAARNEAAKLRMRKNRSKGTP